MISHTLYKNRGHTWFAFGQDPEKPEKIIDTNQLVVSSGEQSIILDPGGLEIFPPMLAALTDKVPIENVKHLFMSHQDPDIGSSLPLWRQVCNPDVEIHLSWLWTSFVAHFDSEAYLKPIPDEGAVLRLGNIDLELIPAHYLHSPGNFSVYDSVARILWTGDIGAALLPKGKQDSFFVEDFDDHIQYMEGFHKRWMGSVEARDAWVNRVSKLDIDILTPQHGLFFKGDNVGRFLDWLGSLPIGSGIASMGAGDTPSLPASPSTPAEASDIEDIPAEAMEEVEVSPAVAKEPSVTISAAPMPEPAPQPAPAPLVAEPEPQPEVPSPSPDAGEPEEEEFEDTEGGFTFPSL